MTKTETIHFMQKIKSYYQNFSLEDYMVNEWADRLKEFDIEEAYKKLDMHLNGEYRNEPPKLHYITNALKKTKENLKAADVKVKCSICGKTINYLDFDSHLARHSSVCYIKSREHYLDQHFNEEQMMNAEQEYFDKFYDNFLEKLHERIENGDEKERLKKILTYLSC